MTNKPTPVEGLVAKWKAQEAHPRANARGTLVACAMELEDALAQQPAAVDGAMVERALDAAFPPTFKRNDALRDMWRTGLTAALAAQPGGSDNDR